jgi:uncharacterized caspase-like protein
VILDSEPSPDLGLPANDTKAFTRVQLYEAITRHMEAARRGGAKYLLFAFSGHGAQVGGTNYLLPAEMPGQGAAENVLRVGGLDLQEVITAANKKSEGGPEPIDHVLVLLDACRDGEARAEVGKVALSKNQGQSLGVFYACTAPQRSWEIPGVGGVFMQQFIRLLDGPYEDWGRFEEDLIPRVNEAAMQASGGKEQHPEYDAQPKHTARSTFRDFIKRPQRSASK